MVRNKCKNCGENTHRPKYCSNECYLMYRRSNNYSIHSEEYKEELSEKMIEVHKNRSKEEKDRIYKIISNKRKVQLTTAQLEKLEEILNTGYCYGFNNFAKHLGCSVRVVTRYIENNKKYKEQREKVNKCTPKQIQLLNIDTYKEFRKDLENISYDLILDKYNLSLGKKSIINLCKRIGVEHVHKTPDITSTKPERVVEGILKVLDIKYKREVWIRRFRCDFMIGKKIIEVQGDYWHANPNMYDSCDLTKDQKSNVERDKRKHQLYKKLGYELLEIWEHDTKHNIEKVKNKIEQYVK